MNRKSKSFVTVSTLALLLAIIQFHVIISVLGQNFHLSMQAAVGVVEGKPHWWVYQNRVLGPYTVHLIERITGDYLVSYVALAILLLTLAGIIAWMLGQRIGQNTWSAFSSILLFHLAFAFLLANPWLYIWDYFGVVIFLIFIYLVVNGKTWLWFLGLSAIAVLNRESVYFIALWMLLDPAIKYYYSIKRFTTSNQVSFDLKMTVAGLACLIGSLILVRLLRETLLIQEMGPIWWPEVGVGLRQSLHFKLPYNIDVIVDQFYQIFPLLLFVIIIAGLCLYLAYKDPYRWAALSSIYLLIITSQFLFGVVPESRIFIDLIPMLILGSLILLTAVEPNDVECNVDCRRPVTIIKSTEKV